MNNDKDKSEDNQSLINFITTASLEIADGDVCFVGIGVPTLAAMVAKRHHAPNAVLVFESGAVDSNPSNPPLSTGSPSVVEDTAMIMSCFEVFSMLQQGAFDVGMLSAAQVDRFGNLNSTELNRPGKSPVRLVGSGGANDIAMLAKSTLILMPHEKRRFCERVDFITSPGLANQPDVFDVPPRGGGPSVLVTPRARFTFSSGELTLNAIGHGYEHNDALDIIPWEVPSVSNVEQLLPVDSDYVATAQSLVQTFNP